MDELDISGQKVFFPNQQHTSKVVFIDKTTDFNKVSRKPVDAVITNLKGLESEY